MGPSAQCFPGGGDVLRWQVGQQPAHSVPVGPAADLPAGDLTLVELGGDFGADGEAGPVQGPAELRDGLPGCVGDDQVLDPAGLIIVEVGGCLDQPPHMPAADLAAPEQLQRRGEQGEQPSRDRHDVLRAVRRQTQRVADRLQVFPLRAVGAGERLRRAVELGLRPGHVPVPRLESNRQGVAVIGRWQGRQQRGGLRTRVEPGKDLQRGLDSRAVTTPHPSGEARQVVSEQGRSIAHMFESCHGATGLATGKALLYREISLSTAGCGPLTHLGSATSPVLLSPTRWTAG